MAENLDRLRFCVNIRVGRCFSQVLLETHFFSNLPKTVKKCVDFVAEVISSHCVKSIQRELMPKLKETIDGSLRARGGQNCDVSKRRKGFRCDEASR